MFNFSVLPFCFIILKRKGIPWYTSYTSPISFVIAFIITIFHSLSQFKFYSFTDISLLHWYFSSLKQFLFNAFSFKSWIYSYFGCHIIPLSADVRLFSSFPVYSVKLKLHTVFVNHTEGFSYQDGRHLKTDCKLSEMAHFYLEPWHVPECVHDRVSNASIFSSK